VHGFSTPPRAGFSSASAIDDLDGVESIPAVSHCGRNLRASLADDRRPYGLRACALSARAIAVCSHSLRFMIESSYTVRPTSASKHRRTDRFGHAACDGLRDINHAKSSFLSVFDLHLGPAAATGWLYTDAHEDELPPAPIM